MRIVTFLTAELISFVSNWACHIDRTNANASVQIHTVGFRCDRLEPWLRPRCVERVYAQAKSHVPGADVVYKSKPYLLFFRWRLNATKDLVARAPPGESIAFLDVDVVVRASLTQLLKPKADVIFARDRCTGNVLNGGVVVFRSSPTSLAFLKYAQKALLAGKTYDGGDQGAYQTAFKRFKTGVSLLPCNLSAPGPHLNHPLTDGLVTMHFNWLRHSVEKRQCMGRAGVWVFDGTLCTPFDGNSKAITIRKQKCK